MKFQTKLSATLLLLLFSCYERQEAKSQSISDTTSNFKDQKIDPDSLRQVKYLRDDGDSLIVDCFEIEIALTEKAKNE